MKRLLLYFFIVLVGFFSTVSEKVIAGGMPPKSDLLPQTSQDLKKYMSKFGILMAGVEVLKLKESKPDWETIDLTVQEMKETLSRMEQSDTTHAYKQYTELLSSGLADIEKKVKRKDKNIYDSFGKLSQTCFGCHAMHRPTDYLKRPPTAQNKK